MHDTKLRARVRADKQGRILVPKELRDAIQMEVNGYVTLLVEDGEIRVITPARATRLIREIAARYHVPGRSAVDELIAERRAEAERD